MSSTRVLFLCTHNSARSQIAEALLRSRGRGAFEVESAGTEATLHQFLDEPFDYVITVCDAANDACPIFPNGGQREHWSLPDPSKVGGSEERQLEAYREVRDDLEIRIMELIRQVGAGATS
jgi:arsenate reductase